MVFILLIIGYLKLTVVCFRRARAENEREWARDIWNKWFDQVFPPTPAESEWESEEEEEEEEDLFALKDEEKPGCAKTGEHR